MWYNKVVNSVEVCIAKRTLNNNKKEKNRKERNKKWTKFQLTWTIF